MKLCCNNEVVIHQINDVGEIIFNDLFHNRTGFLSWHFSQENVSNHISYMHDYMSYQ